MNSGRITADRARELARKARQASPWSRGPNCDTKAARASHARYVKRGKSRNA